MSLLWKITSENGAIESFVFGTMHVKDQRAFSHKALINEAIDSCGIFASEFDLGEANEDEISNHMLLTDDVLLNELLKPKIYKRLGKLLKKHTGLDLDNYIQFKPLFINNLLTAVVFQSDMPISLDEYLYKYASEQQKTIIGIEEYSEQLNLLKELPMKGQVKSLEWTVKNFKKYRKQLLKITDLYQQGDIVRLFKTVKRNAKGMRRILIYNRNIIMAERIGEIAKEKSLFAAIGAGHLPGQKGVLRLLKKQGFTVKAVKLIPAPNHASDVLVH